MEHPQLGSTQLVFARSVGQGETASHFLVAFVRIFLCLLTTVMVVIEGTQQFAQKRDHAPFAIYSDVFLDHRILPARLELESRVRTHHRPRSNYKQ